MAKQSNELKNLLGSAMAKAATSEINHQPAPKPKREEAPPVEQPEERSRGRKSKGLVKVGYTLPPDLVTKIKREAYWEKRTALVRLRRHFGVVLLGSSGDSRQNRHQSFAYST